jgi:hypothetical protein
MVYNIGRITMQKMNLSCVAFILFSASLILNANSYLIGNAHIVTKNSNQIISKLIPRKEKLSMTINEKSNEVRPDYLSILNSKSRDYNSILKPAMKALLKDPSFLRKTNSISLVLEALKLSKAAPYIMYDIWNEMSYSGANPKKQDTIDLLWYCYDSNKRDMNTLNSVLHMINNMNKNKYWNSRITNLIIQIYTENSKIKGISLASIFDHIIEINGYNLIDEKSVVKLMKYFNSVNDFNMVRRVFDIRNKVDKKVAMNVNNENIIIWNTYLIAILKDTSDNTVEKNEGLHIFQEMIGLKIADLYSINIMLTHYLSEINDNENKNNDKIIQNCIDLWSDKYVTILRNELREDLDSQIGINIAYSLIIKCLLLSNCDSNIFHKFIDNGDNDTQNDNNSNDNDNNYDDNENLIKISVIGAFELASQLPSDEVICRYIHVCMYVCV